jgi:GT2 family glycosyltransferase
VLLINNDARLLPNGLDLLGHVFDQCPEALIAFPAINQSGVITRISYYHRITGVQSSRPYAGSFPYASGCCLLVATDRIAGPLFDEDFFMYGEDVELAWRLRNRPGALQFIDKVLVEHDGSASSGMGSAFYENHMVAAQLIVARKLGGNFLCRAAFYFFRAPTLVARGLIRAMRYRSWIPLAALSRGWRIASKSTHRLS